MYAVHNDSSSESIGIYTFCSFCGVHVLYSPSIDPVVVDINVDCLDHQNIDHIFYTYDKVKDWVSYSAAFSASVPFNRRGSGSLTNTIRQGTAPPLYGDMLLSHRPSQLNSAGSYYIDEDIDGNADKYSESSHSTWSTYQSAFPGTSHMQDAIVDGIKMHWHLHEYVFVC